MTCLAGLTKGFQPKIPTETASYATGEKKIHDVRDLRIYEKNTV